MSLHVSLVMTIIGADQPGLVGRLSAVVAGHRALRPERGCELLV